MLVIRRIAPWVTAALVACAAPASDDDAPGTRASLSDPKPEGETPLDAPKPADATPVPGVHAEYFDGYHDLRVERIEPTIDHDWRDAPPVAGVGKDRFSARFTTTLTPAHTARTTLSIDADDGVRLWVNNKLVIDDWRGHFVERHSATVDLVANEPVSIALEYFEIDLAASLKLSWSAPGLTEQVIPADRFTTIQGPTGKPGPKPPFQNPVVPFDCPDPGVLSVTETGRFYAVCTGGSFPIRASRDLVTWENVPNAAILPSGKPSWAANGGRNWAPELHRNGDRFLAYYTSVSSRNVLSVGVASASSPEGPWTDRGSPLVEDPKGVIDATFFIDDDGSRWLFYKIDGNAVGQPTPMLVRQLSADGLSFAPGSVAKQVLVNQTNTWEGGVVEAPWVVKRDGFYYMFYSGNVYDHRYRTGVARATSLQGPWVKKGAPILANNAEWVGPGHGTVLRVNDLDYFVYHAWKNAGNGTQDPARGRMVLVDRIDWRDGWPAIGNGTPTIGAQPWPGQAR